MLVRHIALVSETTDLALAELTQVSAAIQKQVVNDFSPIWNVQATVDAFASLRDIPLGYWPVVIEDDIGDSGAGVHKKDRNNQPIAFVAYTEGWELAASHEVLEMLADPSGDRLVAGESVKDGQGRVEYLLEVCDPCAAASLGYKVNGVLVSDFYTPHFLDPVKSTGVRYDFAGALTEPRQVLKGGYLSWLVPATNAWWQLAFFDDKPKFVERGQQTLAPNQSLRSAMDRLTPELRVQEQRCRQLAGGHFEAARQYRKQIRQAGKNRVAHWRSLIG
jgi:hypothetical protein